MTKSYLDKDGLETLTTGIKSKIKDVDDKTLASINYKANGEKTNVYLVSKDGSTLTSFQIINSLDSEATTAPLGASQGKILKDSIGAKADTPKYFKTTLLSSGWAQNGSTGYYDYTVTRSDITSNTFVDISMDLENLAKITGGAVESSNGKFVISAYDQPTEDIEISVRYSLTTGA